MASTGEPFFYDGSSTESEPFDEEDARAPAPAAAPTAAVSSTEAPAPQSPAAVSHNVLDLFALVPPPPMPGPRPPLRPAPQSERFLAPYSALRAAVSEPRRSPRPPPPVSAAVVRVADASSAAAEQREKEQRCGRCGKLMLADVSSLMARLANCEAVHCHCCELALPRFCFTEPQRAARWPECRACHGVPAVVAALTARVRKLLAPRPPPPANKPKTSKPKTSKPKASKTKTVTPPAMLGSTPWCRKCGRQVASMTEEQELEPDKLECACCHRALPATFYSKKQRGKRDMRRCKGCLGNALTTEVEPSKATKTTATMKKEKEKKEKEKNREAESKREAKELDALEQMRKADEQLEEREVFRNKVARHRFALRAIDRKRRANDLRGSTRAVYLEQLAKEEAGLREVSKLLRRLQPEIYAEVMGEAVRHGNEATSKRARGLGVRDGEYEDEDGPELKQYKPSGLAVKTRSQRRAAEREASTAEVIDLTGE